MLNENRQPVLKNGIDDSERTLPQLPLESCQQKYAGKHPIKPARKLKITRRGENMRRFISV
jgi:hypothetical protein